jgi:hypothetical protein
MNASLNRNMSRSGSLPIKQRGALTMFSAILILILLTELIIYAVQVGVFEQRKSSNEMRQKEAFHVAESALQFTKQYLLENSREVSSTAWLASNWKRCSEAGLTESEGTHPCYAEPADNTDNFAANLRENMYYWDPDDGTLKGTDPYGHPTLPISVGAVIPDATQRVSVYALLCMLDLERDPAARTVQPNSIVQGCTLDTDRQDPIYYMITLLARGEADCDGVGLDANCSARALVAEKIGSFGPAAGEGGPGVPLVARSTLPPGGTAEIVPNPNGGGVGVPISAWINQNTCGSATPPPDPLDPNGASWSTCERHEWYGTDMWPEDYRCPTATCSCSTSERRLSYSDNTGQQYGIDLVPDENFPCDLWKYMFGIPKYIDGEINQEGIDYVRDFLADEIIQGEDCDSLGPQSAGWIWVEGGACNIAAGTEIGSPDTDPDTPEGPVFLIVNADLKLAGGASIFGTLFLSDVLQPTAELAAVGGLTVYGAAVVDTTIDKFSGTYQLVYVEDIINRSVENGRFGEVSGGWTDFHADWR